MKRHRISESAHYVSIHIGEYHATIRPETISTVVGSCVAVCLYDPETKIGGMNHILLPGSANLNDFDLSARYGINAMELLINKMMRLGADRGKIIAKAFGGACTLSALNSCDHIGRKNAEFVIAFLKKEGLKLVGCSLGGTSGRKISFHTSTGVVYLKRLVPTIIKSILNEEQEKQRQILMEVNKPGEVIIF